MTFSAVVGEASRNLHRETLLFLAACAPLDGDGGAEGAVVAGAALPTAGHEGEGQPHWERDGGGR